MVADRPMTSNLNQTVIGKMISILFKVRENEEDINSRHLHDARVQDENWVADQRKREVCSQWQLVDETMN